MFRELGPNARDLLGVVAFFPQGVDENNLDWLFPTISKRTGIFDTFCVLSLTYRSNGFVTMLAPLRDHLYPKDSRPSPRLRTTKEHYFRRLSVEIFPDRPGFDEAEWIMSEDVNIEHLLDNFISIDANSDEVWDVCYHFMEHLFWHKPRVVILGPKIEGFLDDCPSKAKCLSGLGRLFLEVGNNAESKRLLVHSLTLWRERGDDLQVAEALWRVSGVNRMLHLYNEGMQQVKEALEIYERLNDVSGQARSLCRLAYLLHDDGQFDAAEGVALQVINRFLGKTEQFQVCQCYRILGDIYSSKGETEKAIDRHETALEIASSFNWQDPLFWSNYSLAELFLDKGRFDDAWTRIEYAKSHAVNDAYNLGRGVELQARFWYRQPKFEEARSAALHAIDAFERLGATEDVERCRVLLWEIERAESPV
jgi:tetratricopeptide (TPR) repeat protein